MKNNMPRHRQRLGFWLGLACLLGSFLPAQADVDLPSKFDNRGGVANTRHNMTQRQASGGPTADAMISFRNDYGEVCVYCHTPHGANQNVKLPLWNRTIDTSVPYTTYAALGTSTLTQTVTQPGANSLSCLSCHDGQVAVDSVINMPQSGRYLAGQATAQNTTFLDTWTNTNGTRASHGTLSIPRPGDVNDTSCLACHSRTAGGVGRNATDFSAFVIGKDLQNDHPVGVKFPAAGPDVDFNQPAANKPGMRWFDTNANGFADTREVRLYDTGDGFEVECASCHDPHGVPSGAPGSNFNPTFLRVANTGSALCLTCHAK